MTVFGEKDILEDTNEYVERIKKSEKYIKYIKSIDTQSVKEYNAHVLLHSNEEVDMSIISKSEELAKKTIEKLPQVHSVLWVNYKDNPLEIKTSRGEEIYIVGQEPYSLGMYLGDIAIYTKDKSSTYNMVHSSGNTNDSHKVKKTLTLKG